MAKDPKPTSKLSSPAISVSCSTHRRRAGYAFGPEPVIILLDDLVRQQLDALKADPLLVIQSAELAEPAESNPPPQDQE